MGSVRFPGGFPGDAAGGTTRPAKAQELPLAQALRDQPWERGRVWRKGPGGG